MFVQVLKKRTGLVGSYTVILLKLLLNFLIFVFPFCREMQELSGEATSWVEGWTCTCCIHHDDWLSWWWWRWRWGGAVTKWQTTKAVVIDDDSDLPSFSGWNVHWNLTRRNVYHRLSWGILYTHCVPRVKCAGQRDIFSIAHHGE